MNTPVARAGIRSCANCFNCRMWPKTNGNGGFCALDLYQRPLHYPEKTVYVFQLYTGDGDLVNSVRKTRDCEGFRDVSATADEVVEYRRVADNRAKLLSRRRKAAAA